jgi:hypothetical protein
MKAIAAQRFTVESLLLSVLPFVLAFAFEVGL